MIWWSDFAKTGTDSSYLQPAKDIPAPIIIRKNDSSKFFISVLIKVKNKINNITKSRVIQELFRCEMKLKEIMLKFARKH